MYTKTPQSSGIYYIRDNIEKLQLQIHFRHVTSILKLPYYEINEDAFSFDARLSNTIDSECNSKMKSVCIRWQQKLLGRKEVETYKDANNCTTELHKKYYDWITGNFKTDVRQRSKGRSKTRKENKQTKIEDLFKADEIFTYVHEDNYQYTEENCLEFLEQAKYMYIFADSDPVTQLIVLKWFEKQKLLHIYPDFNDIHLNPYIIEVDTNYRHLYEYACANVSKSSISHTIKPILSPILADYFQNSQISKDQFLMPPKLKKRLVFIFNIDSVCSYSYQPLHVRYRLQMPEDCMLEEGLLEGATHSSYCSSKSDVCPESILQNFVFGHTFQLSLLCNDEDTDKEALHIYFELISIDSWGRERVESYAHFTSYLNAGMEEREIQCLRPVETLLERLTRYFIGGKRHLNFEQFFTPAESKNLNIHNRLNYNMFSTGHMHISCQALSQRNSEICKNLYSGMTLDDILKSFIQAREKLKMLVSKE